MNLTFDTRLRIPFPQPARLDLQSFYFFNTYRAGSSVFEAAAEAFAEMTGRTRNNVTKLLYEAGTEFIDNLNYEKPVFYLADEGASLLQLCDIGGYLNYGFREVPPGFAAGFTQVGASLLVVRDPRDIGISHYAAILKHDDTNPVYGDHVRGARAVADKHTLDSYLLSDELIGFLNRICLCYRPMIERGMPVVRYEQLYVENQFDVRMMCSAIFEAFVAFDDGTWDLETFTRQTRLRIANSRSLQGHSTGGRINMHADLPPAVLEAYSDRLRDALELLGY